MDDDHSQALTSKQSRNIMKQMEKSVCKITKSNLKTKTSGTGFLCNISTTPVLITNNHILDENDIQIGNEFSISFEDGEKTKIIKIDKNRKKYTINKLNGYEVDVTIIEINKKGDDLLEQEFLELDDNLFENNVSDIYKGKYIYIIQYPIDKSCSYSTGKIKRVPEKDKSFDINHSCSTEVGAGGSPIFLYNNKVIAVHRGCLGNEFNYNIGTLLKYPIEEFNKKN